MIPDFFAGGGSDILQLLAISGLFDWFGASYGDRFRFETKLSFEAGDKSGNYSSLKSA